MNPKCPRLALIACASLLIAPRLTAAQQIPSPAQRFGHVIGADRQLVGWDSIVSYFRMVGERSDRVNTREVGRTTDNRPFLLLEISSAETMTHLDRYKALQRRLYFQDATPGQDPATVYTPAQKQELLDQQKAVVLITANIHSTEIGASQMALDLVYELATANDSVTRKILDNVIFLFVPSQNPDGEAMVTDWYMHYVGTDYEGSAPPWLYHHYTGHDDNRDLYMLTQVESQTIARVLYEEWFPSVWLDEHQMGSNGARIFVMPATDPVNLNVHPLVYRWNGIFGQAQGAALENAGKVGIIYNATYTNYWPGAMAWTGWWHNQVGMLTEVASVRIASPTDQHTVRLGERPSGQAEGRGGFGQGRAGDTLPAPRDAEPRTVYPRPWLGGHWTLKDIVDYELIASRALLETAADTRRQLIEQIYDVNRQTIAQFVKGQKRSPGGRGYQPVPATVAADSAESGRVMDGAAGAAGTPYGIVIPADQADPVTVAKLLQTLAAEGVIVERATAAFQAAGHRYAAGTFVIRLAQVFGRYAKDMLEAQTYPEVRLTPQSPPEPPYDVTAWSLGMQMGVATTFVDQPFEASLEVLKTVPLPAGGIHGSGGTFLIDAVYNDGFAAVNDVWSAGGRVRRAAASFAGPERHRFAAGTWVIEGISREAMQRIAGELGLDVYAGGAPSVRLASVNRPRIGVYQPWGSNMDEGWTRWVLDHYGFAYTTLHPQDVRAANPAVADSAVAIPDSLRAMWPPHVKAHAPPRVAHAPFADRFDVLLFTDQSASGILDGSSSVSLPPTYRGGIGEQGLAAVWDFVRQGGTVVALGSAGDLFIAQWPIPVRDVSEGLSSDELLIPGSIVRVQVDNTHPLAWGMPDTTYGYFIRSPFYALTEGFRNQTVSVPVRFPNANLRASGWVRGAEYVQGTAAAVEVDFPAAGQGRAGKLILVGLRPQHRAQTHATFKLLFNALVGGR
jgi:Zinc carboxypeptidase